MQKQWPFRHKWCWMGNYVLPAHLFGRGRTIVPSMRRPEISPQRFRIVVRTAFGSLYAIIVTGSLVRLTGSGLGCSDWPNCNSTKFVDVSTGHAAIEQVNRLFTGVVAASVIVAVSSSVFLKPRSRKITANAAFLVLGVLVQVILGAYVVLTGLNPWSNMAHFLVSIMLVTASFVLVKRVESVIAPASAAECEDRWPRWCLIAAASAVLLLGTVVTGAGPHSGAEQATRLGISVKHATQMHSFAVWVMVFLAVLVTFRARKNSARWVHEGPLMLRLLAALCAQGFIGYVQYFAGVPAPLVAVHVALSVTVWLCALAVFLPASTLLVLD